MEEQVYVIVRTDEDGQVSLEQLGATELIRRLNSSYKNIEIHDKSITRIADLSAKSGIIIVVGQLDGVEKRKYLDGCGPLDLP